jgi:hypothetical protein
MSWTARSAEVVEMFIRLSQARDSAEVLPDLSLVKALLQEEIVNLSFEDLGKRCITLCRIGKSGLGDGLWHYLLFSF